MKFWKWTNKINKYSTEQQFVFLNKHDVGLFSAWFCQTERIGKQYLIEFVLFTGAKVSLDQN